MKEVYKNIVETYLPSIIKTSKKLDYDNYEDLVNDTVVRIMNRKKPLKYDTNHEGFCVCETYRQFYSNKRKNSLRIRGDRWKPGLKDSGFFSYSEFDDSFILPSPANQEDSVLLNETISLLSSLSFRRRRYLLMYVFGGLEQQEIAKKEGVAVSTVCDTIAVARMQLSSLLECSAEETPKKVMLQDVVEASGYSKATVSMVVKGTSQRLGRHGKITSHVSEKARTHILAVAEKLGYVHPVKELTA